MFVDNGHKRTFLGNLIKDYHAKKKVKPTQRKSCGDLMLDQNLGKNLQR